MAFFSLLYHNYADANWRRVYTPLPRATSQLAASRHTMVHYIHVQMRCQTVSFSEKSSSGKVGKEWRTAELICTVQQITVRRTAAFCHNYFITVYW